MLSSTVESLQTANIIKLQTANVSISTVATLLPEQCMVRVIGSFCMCVCKYVHRLAVYCWFVVAIETRWRRPLSRNCCMSAMSRASCLPSATSSERSGTWMFC